MTDLQHADSTQQWRTPIIVAVLLTFALKIFIALTTLGTIDVATWATFTLNLHEHRGVEVYHHLKNFNHPPFMIHALRMIYGVTEITGLPFEFCLRFPAILADVGSIVLVGKILARAGGPSFPWAAWVMMATAPASIMISGFHGNTDPVMIFFLLLSVYWLEQKPSAWLGGMAFGMSMNIKVVPILLLPAIWLWLPNLRRRAEFSMAALSIFGVGSLPYLAQDPVFILARVFGYPSIFTDWGIAQILVIAKIFAPATAPLYDFYLMKGRLILVLCMVSTAFWINRRPIKPPLFLQCGLMFSLFLVMTPGFGVQYLAWLVPWVVGLGMTATLTYYLTSGVFLFLTYTFWSGGFPWYLANALKMREGGAYIIPFDLLCWGSVIMILVIYFKRLPCWKETPMAARNK